MRPARAGRAGFPGVVVAVAALLAGCASSSPAPSGCSYAPATCSAFSPDCSGFAAKCRDAGPTRAWVEIDSSPTPAAIYLDGQFIGYSPLRYALAFSSTTRLVSLAAVPLHPGQAQQERLIQVPPLPTRVSFFMNNPPADADPGAEPAPEG